MECRSLDHTALADDVRSILDTALDDAGLTGPLFLAGNPAILCQPRVAAVGTREPAPWTLSAIEGLAASLASLGACLVSGGAVGTDCAAHSGALHAGGATVVVAPCPLEDISLSSWRSALSGRWDLARTLFLSPFPRGTRPRRGHPLVRNRLIATLATAGVVGATGLTGGTNHFIRLALDRRMPLFFLDSRPEDPVLRQALETLHLRGAVPFSEDEALEARALSAKVLAAAASFERRVREQGSAQLRWCEDEAEYLTGGSN
ncbi:MAG: processing protein [Candidatus Sumerlaeota bacterium]|nr:processing protein [Candidatus Sumerlaeota bacterium]